MNGDYIEFDLTAKGFTMTEQKGNTGEKREQKTEKKEIIFGFLWDSIAL